MKCLLQSVLDQSDEVGLLLDAAVSSAKTLGNPQRRSAARHRIEYHVAGIRGTTNHSFEQCLGQLARVLSEPFTGIAHKPRNAPHIVGHTRPAGTLISRLHPLGRDTDLVRYPPHLSVPDLAAAARALEREVVVVRGEVVAGEGRALLGRGFLPRFFTG